MGRYKKCCYNCKHLTMGTCKGCDTFGKNAYQNFELREELAKLESGELLELPCKVGDTVYVVYKDEWEYSIYAATAIGFYINEEHGIEIITDFNCYPCDRIGNFTTKAAAEDRLRALILMFGRR